MEIPELCRTHIDGKISTLAAILIRIEKLWIVCQICCRGSNLAPDRQQLRQPQHGAASLGLEFCRTKNRNGESAQKAAVNRSICSVANDKERRREVGEYVEQK